MSERNSYDHYPTPPALIRAAIESIPPYVIPTRILDPGAGSGGWGAAARRRWPHAHLIGVELRQVAQPAAYNTWLVGDFLSAHPAPVDLILGNPPYALAQSFVRHALTLLEPGGALLFLLRLSFLASMKRRAFWQAHPPSRVSVCVPRPSFTNDGGTDSAEYGLFLWRRGATIAPVLDWLDWAAVPATQPLELCEVA